MKKIRIINWQKIFCYLLLICYLAIPFSLPIDIGSFQLNLPVEPILVIVAFLLLFMIDIKKLASSSFFRHPLTLLAMLYHLCMLISISYSTDFMVSVKYVLINSLHFWVFYFGIYYLSIHQVDIRKIWYAYIICISIIICYSFIRYAAFNFMEGIAPELARPFYSDHTIFGASLALLFPFLILNKFDFIKFKYLRSILILLFSIAIINTKSQAVWLSLGLGLITYIGIKKYKFNTRSIHLLGLIFVLLITMLLFFVHQTDIQSASKPLNSTSVVKKLGLENLSNDVSTMERINRYSCALRMWKDHPIAGFGAGTFQFAYLPYQLPMEMTRISVTTSRAFDGKPHSTGKGGGAHSEYFQSFVELGILGGIIWLLFVSFTIHYSLKIYYLTLNPDNFTLSIFIALLGYFIHALFNNFLHNEEISFLFWSMIGMIVYYDSGSEAKP